MKGWFSIASAAMGLLLAACGGTAAPSVAPSASSADAQPSTSPASAKPAASASAAVKPAAGEDWNQVLAAAKKEGSVIIWGGNGPQEKAFEKDAFEKAYPDIKVDLFQAPISSDRDSRFIQEYQAGIAKVDVLISGSAGVNARVKPQGMLQDIHPFLRPEILDSKTWLNGELLWVDKEQKFMLMSDTAINPVTVNKSVKDSDMQKWSDLLDPKYKGKVVMTDPRQSGPGFAAAVFMFNGLGKDFTSKFYANSPVFSPDERQNIEWTDSGRALANIGVRPNTIRDIQKVGGTVEPHDALNDDSGKPTMGFSGSSGILFVPNLNPLPHPNAVKVYVNWFYSKEGQQAMVDTLAQPSHRVDVDMSKLPQWAVPRAGVKYLNLNDERYTSTAQVQAMRDDVNKWYKAP